MAFSQDRLSTVPVTADWIPPDERERINLLLDYEAGPIAISNSTGGMFYQPWTLEYNPGTGDFVVTPETVGAPVTVLNHANVEQCTLAFDQNGNVTLAFTALGQAKLYWYDTLAAAYVTDDLAADVIFPTVCLDDKRRTQTTANDILLFYTRPDGSGGYNFYFRKQRERFNTERLLASGVPPFMYKAGMNYGARVQIALLDSIPT